MLSGSQLEAPTVYTEEDKELEIIFVFCAQCHEGVGMYGSRRGAICATGEIAAKMQQHRCDMSWKTN